MTKFKTGQKIRHIFTGEEDLCTGAPGEPYYDSCGFADAKSGIRTAMQGWERQKNWKIINSTNNMSVKEKFTTLFKVEPEKSFRKAGIINGDDLLTEEGQTIFLSWLLKHYGEKFKTEVLDPILAEEKSDK